MADPVVDVREEPDCELGGLDVVEIYHCEVAEYEPLILLPVQVLAEFFEVAGLVEEHDQFGLDKGEQGLSC